MNKTLVRLIAVILFIAYLTTFNYGGCGGGGGGSSTPAPTPLPTATRLGFIQQPTNVATGAVVSPAITVAVQDSTGNTLTSATNAVTIAIVNNPGAATLSGTLTQNAVNGIATFNNLSLNKSGTGYTLQANTTGLTSATSNAFNVTSSPAKLTFIQQPSNTIAGAVVSPAITVAVQDSTGNTLTSATNAVTIAIVNNTSGATLFGTLTQNAVNGIATFNNLSINMAKTGYVLQATATGLTSVTSNGFNITPTIALTRSIVKFSINEGQLDLPAAQSIFLSTTGNISWSGTTPNATWLKINNKAPNTAISGNLTPVTGTTFSLALTSNASTLTLSGGVTTTYTTMMQITATGAANSPQTITIQIEVTPWPPTTPVINVTATTLNFTCPQVGPNPLSQQFTVSNIGVGTMTLDVETSSNWLGAVYTAPDGSGGLIYTVSIDVVPYFLEVGTYTGWIKVWAMDLTTYEEPPVNPVTIRVNLTVTGSVTVPPGRDWTILVYMNADNNLERCGISNILEMQGITSTYNTNEAAVIVLCDRWAPLTSDSNYSSNDIRDGNWTGARAFLIQNGSNPNVINSPQLVISGLTGTEPNMGLSSTLTTFINYSVTNYPANNYALIVWNHGAGWQGVGWDDNDGTGNESRLTGPGLMDGIKASGQYFDLVIFNECLDANLELCYEIRDKCSWIVASEDVEYAFYSGGNLFKPWLEYLVSNTSAVSTVQPLALAQKYATVYFDQFADGGRPNVTISIINSWVLSNTLKSRLDTFAGYLKNNINTTMKIAARAKNNVETFDKGGWNYRDLADFAWLIYNDNDSDSTLKSYAADVYWGVHDSVVYRNSYKGHPCAYGIQISLPDVEKWTLADRNYFLGTSYNGLYYTTSFAKNINTTWDLFLSNYYAAKTNDVTNPVVSVLSQTSTPISYTSQGEYSFYINELNPVIGTFYIGKMQGNELVLMGAENIAPSWTTQVQGGRGIPDWSSASDDEVWNTFAACVYDANSSFFAYPEYDNPQSPVVVKYTALLNGVQWVKLNFDYSSGKLLGVFPYSGPQGQIDLGTGDLIKIKTMSYNYNTGVWTWVDAGTFTYDDAFSLWFGYDIVPNGNYSLFLSITDVSGNLGVSALIPATVQNQ